MIKLTQYHENMLTVYYTRSAFNCSGRKLLQLKRKFVLKGGKVGEKSKKKLKAKKSLKLRRKKLRNFDRSTKGQQKLAINL